MSTTEFLATALVFAAYFGVPAGLLAAAIYRRRLATDDVASGRHHRGRLRAARRRAESAYRTARRLAVRHWRRLDGVTVPVAIAPAPLVHGLAAQS